MIRQIAEQRHETRPSERESTTRPRRSGGYVALFEIEDRYTVTILAIRHRREDDYH